MDPFDQDLEATLKGRLAGGSLNIIEETLDVLEARIDQRVFDVLKTGRGFLSPEHASQAWYEKYAISALRDKLRHLAQRGNTAAKRIAPQMEIGSAS